MAKIFLVTLSEANGNDIDAQEWALTKICTRVAPLGTVTLTTTNSTFAPLSTLIELVVQLYDAKGGDCRGEIKQALEQLLEQAEGQLDPDQVEIGREHFKSLFGNYWQREFELDERSDELKDRDIRYFFKPKR